MKFTTTDHPPEQQPTDCVVVAIYESGELSPAAQQLDQASAGALRHIIERGDISGKLGQTRLLYQLPGVQAERVLLVGCGKRAEAKESNYRKTIMATMTALKDTGCTDAGFYLSDIELPGRDAKWKATQIAQLSSEAMYHFDQLKSKKDDTPEHLTQIMVALETGAQAYAIQAALEQGRAIGSGVALARDLGNLPGNVCTPSYLAQQAQQLQTDYDIKTTILEQADMEKLGMGSLLSVARGSREPAKLIVMEYHGGKKNAAPVVLVGKGLTFDAGGISIKPAAAMDEMKFDMCGGASVLGTFKAIAELKLGINVVGIIPSCENLPDGAANKPGDIVTSMSGQTIEILNTDAEGRLILCDALSYSERYKPALVVDIATLTGACVVALGAHAIGLLGNDNALAQQLLQAGEQAYDRAWQLPLWEDYQSQLDSNFADMANVGGREAGTITAACFLSRYTKNFPWAHLDIAGTAWKSGKEKGATGRAVPLLTQFLINKSKEKR